MWFVLERDDAFNTNGIQLHDQEVIAPASQLTSSGS